MLDALGIQSRFHEGLRVTDEATLEVAEMVFAGSVNKSLARELNDLGVPAAGISGTDGPTLLVEPVPELGRVGSVTAGRVGPHRGAVARAASCPSWRRWVSGRRARTTSTPTRRRRRSR